MSKFLNFELVFLNVYKYFSCHSFYTCFVGFAFCDSVCDYQKRGTLLLPKTVLFGSLITSSFSGLIAPILTIISWEYLYPIIIIFLLCFFYNYRKEFNITELRLKLDQVVWIIGVVVLVIAILIFRGGYGALDWQQEEPIISSEKIFDLTLQQSYTASSYYPPNFIWLWGEKVWYHSLHQLIPGFINKILIFFGLELCSGVVFNFWHSLFFTQGLINLSAISLFILTSFLKNVDETTLPNSKKGFYISIFSLLVGIAPLAVASLTHILTISSTSFFGLLGNILPYAYVVTPAIAFIGGDPHSFVYALSVTSAFIGGMVLWCDQTSNNSKNKQHLIGFLLCGTLITQIGGHPGSLLFLATFCLLLLVYDWIHQIGNWKSLVLYFIFIIVLTFLLKSPAHEHVGVNIRFVPFKLGTTVGQFIDAFFTIIPVFVISFFTLIRADKNLDIFWQKFFRCLALSLFILFLFCEFISYDHPIDIRDEWRRFNPLLRHWLEIFYFSSLLLIPIGIKFFSKNNFWEKTFFSLVLILITLGFVANFTLMYKRVASFPYKYTFDGLSFLKYTHPADADIVQALQNSEYKNAVILETCGDGQNQKFNRDFSWGGRIATYSGRYGVCGWNLHIFRYQTKFKDKKAGFEYVWPYVQNAGKLATTLYKNQENILSSIKNYGITHVIYGSAEIELFGTINPWEFAQKTGLKVKFYSPHNGGVIFEVTS